MTSTYATETEIHQQPEVWRRFALPLDRLAAEIRQWAKDRQHDEIWFSGAGTSAFIGETLAAQLNAAAGPARFRAVPSTDLVACPQNYLRPGLHILVVSFGRSGDSSESRGVLDLLDSHAAGYDRLHITCNAASALATRAMPAGATGQLRHIILPEQTNDRGFAMTSSYTTMLLSALAVFAPPATSLGALLDELADLAEAVIEKGFAEPVKLPARAVFLGAGALAGAAREAALKTLELTAGEVVTMFDTPLGFRHGPKAIVNAETDIFVFRSSNAYTAKYEQDLIAELGQQYHPDQVKQSGPFALTGGNEAWAAVLHVISGQILAFRWSEALHKNVDDPFAGRNLTRVVSGVTLYPFDDARSGTPDRAYAAARTAGPAGAGFAGIDIGGTKIESRLFDSALNEISRKRIPVQRSDYQAVVNSVSELIGQLRQQGGENLAIGIGLPGIVDPVSGQSTTANLPATGLPITREITDRVGGPLYFANDCKLFALSEAIGGAGDGAQTIFGLIIGTGVGGGVVHAGQLVTGMGGLPGEVGHFGIPGHLGLPDIACGCGWTGCYETFLSGEGLRRLAKLETGRDVPSAAIFQLAEAGDPAMQKVVERWYQLLTEMLLTIQLTVDPDMIVIGGGVSATPGLAERAQKALAARKLRGTRTPKIAIAQFGDASGARGAAIYAAQQIRNEP